MSNVLNESEGVTPDAEKRDYKFYEEHPEEATDDVLRQYPKLLNNFHRKFPVPQGFEEPQYRAMVKQVGWHTENMRASADTALHSALFLDQTYQAFDALLDRIVYEIAPDYDARYRAAAQGLSPLKMQRVIPDHLTDVYIAVYRRMREMGYEHWDLIS